MNNLADIELCKAESVGGVDGLTSGSTWSLSLYDDYSNDDDNESLLLSYNDDCMHWNFRRRMRINSSMMNKV